MKFVLDIPPPPELDEANQYALEKLGGYVRVMRIITTGDPDQIAILKSFFVEHFIRFRRSKRKQSQHEAFDG